MSIFLGLASALSWGTADFLGGVQSRRMAATAVALWSQAAGAVILFAVIIGTGQEFGWAGFAWGAAAGAFTGLALVLFYRALSSGDVGMVAPISACGVIIPVAWALVRGDAPSALQLAGISAAFVGVVLVSIPGTRTPHATASRRSSILMALGAAIGFGTFYVFVDAGSGGAASPLWVVGGARASSFTMIGAVALLSRTDVRWPRPLLLPVALTGALDTSANALFAYATTHGNVAVVSTFASLYPVTTVVLAWTLTVERFTPLRAAGAALALSGVVLLSTG